MNKKNKIKLHAAFTLLEILFSISLLIIITLIAVPSFTHFFHRQQARVIANELITVLQYARQEAVQRKQMITVCPSQDHQHCTSEWGKDLIVFVGDQDSVSDPKNIIRIYVPPPVSGTLQFRGFASHHRLVFFDTGMVRQNGRFSYRSGRNLNKTAWQVIISRAGRVRIAYT